MGKDGRADGWMAAAGQQPRLQAETRTTTTTTSRRCRTLSNEKYLGRRGRRSEEGNQKVAVAAQQHSGQ